MVADASVCDSAQTTDNRLDSYPLGENSVRFDAAIHHVGISREAHCTTAVHVIDTLAPVLSCESSVTVVRAAPDDPYPSPPQGSATDLCDDALTVTVTPTTLTESVSEVVTQATDSSGNESECTTAIDVLNVYAVTDFRLLGAEMTGSGGTRLTLGWEPPQGDANEVQLQRSATESGPWEDLSAAGVAAQVMTTTQTEAAWYRLVSHADEAEGGATDPLFVHAIGDDAYDVRRVEVATVPFDTTLYGVVRHPADMSDGPYPLVLLMHGNHGNCRRNGTTDDYCSYTSDHECSYGGYSTTPNAEGLGYLAEMLAARGMVAASVSANAMNCREDYILERAELLRTHLSYWADWNAGDSGDMGTKFAGKLDLSRVGLVGHSRGGDAVSQVPQVLKDSPVAGVDVISIFAIAPTDYHDATVFESAWAVLLPACDGDVSSLWGADIYERSDDTVWHKSQVFFPGANHNYFSTEWYYDDGQWACESRDRVGWDPQLTMLQASLGSWMSHTLDAHAPESFQRAEVPTPSSVSVWAGEALDTRWAYTQEDALLIDAFTGDGGVNELGGANTYSNFAWSSQCTPGNCGDAFLHETTALRLNWENGSSALAEFSLGGSSTDAYDAISFRVASRDVSWNNGRAEHGFTVIVEDEDGDTASFDVRERTPVPHLYSAYDQREVLQTIRLPFAEVEGVNPAVNTTRIARVSLDFGTDSLSGSVLLTDLQLGY